MTRSTRKRIGTVLAVAAAGTVFMSGTAWADDSSISTIGYTGRAEWTEDGDTLTVCDKKSDGWGVRGYIYRPKSGDPANGTVLIKGNDPKHDDNCFAVSVNVAESIPLSIKVCNYAADRIVNCDYTTIAGRP